MASENRVVTGKARLSYVNLLKPYARPGQDEKYSVTVLVPKADTMTKAKIDAAIEAAIQAGVQKRWDGKKPGLINIPVHDGDGARPSDGEPFGPECKGHWVFTASCKADRPPRVVDLQVNDILDAREVYSGMYGRVSVDFFAYNSQGRKGIGAGLNNVQKLADGEPLGGGTTAEDDFADSLPTGGTTAQPYQGNQARINPLTGQPM
ncbi:MAG: DUF2815 family protein [Eubacteriales bacterium]|jgi:hypothetical protein|nr:DUF2815 family protein [Eubacteriales bacterium]